MRLTLLLSDIIPPPQFVSSPPPPTLDRLVQSAGVTTDAGCALEESVLAAFSLPRENAPIAALTRLADTGAPGDQSWLRADPVHLSVSRDNVQLFDSHVLAPSEHEMAAIAKSINAHFVSDAVRIEFPDPARGYLQWQGEFPVTTPLWCVQGGSLFDHMPAADAAGKRLRQLLTETQMLLHTHPVNVAREAAGALTINGLWFWGAGALPAVTTSFDRIVARLALARGCAMAAKTPLDALPNSFGDLALSAGHTLVVLHQATRELRRQSREGWFSAVAEIEQQWLAPAANAFSEGKIEALTLVLPNEVACYRLDARRPTLWRRVVSGFHGHRLLADFKK